PARLLHRKGYTICATEGTARFLNENGVPAIAVYLPGDDRQPQVLDMLLDKKIDLVVNIPKNLTPKELGNGFRIRRTAIDLNIPLLTNSKLASAFINAFCELTLNDIKIKSWDEY
ncbi:MAG: carbamoyl phosphate synthase large subunit, partial [Paramuribaculum sp.]|nr:carbamoyl phosphate synthase large subunit [Paramuribaculum sp.]